MSPTDITGIDGGRGERKKKKERNEVSTTRRRCDDFLKVYAATIDTSSFTFSSKLNNIDLFMYLHVPYIHVIIII